MNAIALPPRRNGALSCHLQIALAPWRQRRERWWITALLVALAFVPALLYGWFYTAAIGGQVAAGTVFVLLQALWLVQFGSLLRQNHPIAARLVPQHLQRLREHAAATLLALAALSGAVTGCAFGKGVGFALLAALFMTVAALFLRWAQLWFAMAVLPVSTTWLGANPVWRGLRTQFAALYQQEPLLVVTLAALLLPALNCLHLRAGGERHLRSYARGERMRRTLRDAMLGQSTARHQGVLGYRIARLFTLPYRAWMDRLIAGAQPRNVLARAELAFGAGTHWTAQLGGALVFLLILAVTMLVATIGYGVDFATMREHAGFGVTIGAMSTAINPVLALRSSLHGSRRTQALLMLLPGMPRGAALNRALALRHARQFGVAWALGLLFAAGLTFGTRAFWPALTFSIACLPAGLLLWRDWARQPTPTANGQFWPVMLFMLGGALLAGLVQWAGLPFWAVAIGVPVATLVLGRRRWRRVAAFPQAMPVGRLA